MRQLIHYRINWKPGGNVPGARRGLAAGTGEQLRALVMLRDNPDPRRLDLRASLRDPFGRLWVKDFYLNTAFKVMVLLDVSASMAYAGQNERMRVARDIAEQLAISAYRSGDAFGVFSANGEILKSGVLPAGVNRSSWLWVRRKLGALMPFGDSAAGLLRLVPQLPQRRSLVFVVSDFRWPAGRLEQLFRSLAHHDVVPVLLQDPAEMSALPQRGFAALRDMESGRTRFVWMRAALREKIEAARLRHVRAVQKASRRFGFVPFVVNGAFDPARMNQYFMERHA